MIHPRLSRRRFVGGLCAGSLGVPLLSMFLSGCGGSDDPVLSGDNADPNAASRYAYLVPANASVADSLISRGVLAPVVNVAAERDALRALQAGTTDADRALGEDQVRRTASARWNERTRALVAANRLAPPIAARLYALVAAAQYDAALASGEIRRRLVRELARRPSAWIGNAAGAYFADTPLAVAEASAHILASLLPAEARSLLDAADRERRARLLTGLLWESDAAAAAAVGAAAAANVVAHGDGDGASAARSVTAVAPMGDGIWNGVNPVLTGWPGVKTWCIENIAAMRPAPPPAWDSPEFRDAIAEVRRISDTRSAEQLAIARFWADGGGTATPPGHWNEIAVNLINRSGQSELEAARTLAVLNVALHDAAVCCWDAKYAYWLIRPSQADPAITTPVGLPNFPSYTSGHSTFSGAAAEVLGARFPADSAELDRMAEEASLSRLYGGIHYRFDCEQGLRGGRTIGQTALRTMG